jgi:NAD(P)-dependent dehydrogenase (short-subunit alcohol dehydrogenase family)
MAIHDFDSARDRPIYCASKNAGTLLMQLIAKDTPPEKMQVISFHPGAILTQTVRRASGYDENSFPWDDGKHYWPCKHH